jgi:drug/metabolite transporter (DMT)-like permease
VSPQRLGILLALAGMLLFALNDVLGKWLVATYSVSQVVMLRSIAAVAVLVFLMWRHGTRLFPVEKPRLQAIRVAASALEVACFYWAVRSLPLADVMTYWLATPIYVAAASPWLLGERVGPWRWGAILLGFVGVLVALRPGEGGLSPAVIVSLIGSAAFAVMIVSARALRGTPDLALVFWQTAGAGLAAAVVAPIGWVATPPVDLALLATLGIVSMVAHLAIARALKLADAATISPLQYTLLLWAVIFGWLVFGDVPGRSLLIGAAIIVASGLVIWVRETRARRAPDLEAALSSRDG